MLRYGNLSCEKVLCFTSLFPSAIGPVLFFKILVKPLKELYKTCINYNAYAQL